MTATELDALRDHWEAQGWIRVPRLIAPDRVGRLRGMAENALCQWRLCNPETGEAGGFGGATVMRHLNHPGHFAGRREFFVDLMELVADPAVLDVVRAVLQDEPLFRCTSLFFNPLQTSVDGHWHRDIQFGKSAAEERRVLEAGLGQPSGGVQLQIALVPSSDSQYVPGSHRRWDTEEEYRVRRADDFAHHREPLPGAVEVTLEPGDAVAFDAVGLHRGRYHADKFRRTLMLTYTASSRDRTEDYFSQQPWFLGEGYLDGLSEPARAFFQRFIEAYRPFWEREAAASRG